MITRVGARTRARSARTSIRRTRSTCSGGGPDGDRAAQREPGQGEAFEPRDGADRATLERIAALAMRAWPSAAAETAETATAEAATAEAASAEDGGGRGAQGRTATAP
ncbi:hypothetical protein ACFVT9_03665 [Kitasatospora cineracea]|uniref:hypothetical protein n=1 Tax=Kitasatospora cineracea TaxID=88074 RepID=UPI0036DE2E6B